MPEKKGRDFPLSPTPTPSINQSVYQKLPKSNPSKLQGYLEASGGSKEGSGAAGMNYNVNKNLSVNVNAVGGKDKLGAFNQYDISATVKLPIGKRKK